MQYSAFRRGLTHWSPHVRNTHDPSARPRARRSDRGNRRGGRPAPDATETVASAPDPTETAAPEGDATETPAVAPAARASGEPASDLPPTDVPTSRQPTEQPGPPAAAPAGGDDGSQTSLAAPAAPVRALSYAVDIVFCIDVTGSMTPILDAVKANALRFYDDVQTNLTDKGKNVDELRVRVIAFRDFAADGDAALQESPFFALPAEQADFSGFVNGLVAEGGGDAPESGLEAVALAMNSPWTTRGDRRRQVIVVWTDQPAHPLDSVLLPRTCASAVPADFSALTDLWEDPQGPLGSSSKRLILFAPDGPGWSDISGGLGERRPPPVAGRRRAVRRGLRHDHRLHRQLRVSERGRPRPGSADATSTPVDGARPATARRGAASRRGTSTSPTAGDAVGDGRR